MKKAYAKVKEQELADDQNGPSIQELEEQQRAREAEEARWKDGQEGSARPGLHPDRQAMLQEKPRKPEQTQTQTHREPKRDRRSKRSAFAKEMEIAQKRQEAAEKKRAEREFRQKDRDAMARARRPDQFGKKRLGRESKVLLGRVQHMLGA